MMLSTYKVVLRNKDNELTSLDPPCESLRVVYPVRDWARATVGGLLCFDTAFSAYAAYSRSRWYLFEKIEIWEAWGKDPVELPKRRFEVLSLGGGAVSEGHVKRLWSRLLNSSDLVYRFTNRWPIGTLAFREVSLRYPVITDACWNDPRKLDGETYVIAHKSMREAISNVCCHEFVYLTLGFETRESFRLAYEGLGPITVGQAYRVVSYGIEAFAPKAVEPLFYALCGFRPSGKENENHGKQAT
jgi:hypothetical protein